MEQTDQKERKAKGKTIKTRGEGKIRITGRGKQSDWKKEREERRKTNKKDNTLDTQEGQPRKKEEEN